MERFGKNGKNDLHFQGYRYKKRAYDRSTSSGSVDSESNQVVDHLHLSWGSVVSAVDSFFYR